MSRLDSVKVALSIIAVILLWGSAFVGIRYSTTDFHPGSMALFRYAVASIVMFFFYFPIKGKTKVTGKDFLSLAFFGIIGFSVYNVALNYGEITVTASVSSFVVGCTPVLATILAILFLKESIAKLGYIGMLINIIGLTLILVGEQQAVSFNWGIIYVFIAMFSGALYSGLHRKLLKKFSTIEFISYAIWIGTAAMLIYTPQLLHDLTHANLTTILVIIYMGIFPGAIGYFCWSYALSKLPVTRAASFLYVLPLATTLMGIAFLHEKPSLISFCGGLVTLAGAIVVNLAKHHALKPQQTTSQ